MAARVSSCVADAQCRASAVSEAGSETVRGSAQSAPEIPSWELIVTTIRDRAIDEDPGVARDLIEWADFLEGSEQLRREESSYQKKS